MGSSSNRFNPKSLSVARVTGLLIISFVSTSAAVLIPDWATVGMPDSVFERLPVVISEMTSACGSEGFDLTERFRDSASEMTPFSPTMT